MNLDFLAFAAHPDDAELSMGGTIAKMINSNKSFGIVDLTQGEQGTRGTILTRAKEAKDAGNILNLTIRENLKLADGNLFLNEENTIKIVEQIRKYKPNIIFAPHFNDRHPDHSAASQIIKRAMFLSGLPKLVTELEGIAQEAYRPKKLFYYFQTYEFEPTFVTNISDTFEQKMEAVRAYKTQFHIEGLENNEPQTFISSPEFMKFLEARAKFYGFKIGKKYGEPFFSEELIELNMANFVENN